MVVAFGEPPLPPSLPSYLLPLLCDLHATREEDGGGSSSEVGLDLSHPPSPHPPSPLDPSSPPTPPFRSGSEGCRGGYGFGELCCSRLVLLFQQAMFLCCISIFL